MAGTDRAWFRWSYYHPAEAEDPQAAFAAGVRIGHQQMLDSSAEWAQLVPLMTSLLEELICLREERAIEQDIVSSDTRSF